MATLATLRTRIADDLARADLTSQISAAIDDAIQFYGMSERFWMGENVQTFSTVAGQEWYTDAETGSLLSVMGEDDSVTVTVSGYPYPLRKVTYETMEALSTAGTTRGIPAYYCFYRQRMRFYPAPDAVRTITLSFVRFSYGPTVSNTAWRDAGFGPVFDTAEGFWTTEAEELIRLHAKIDLLENVIRDFTEADRLKPRLQMVLTMLRGVANKRNGSGQIAAEYL